MRLDRWFKTHYAALPHSRLEKLLRTGQVRVDGARAKASTRLAEGQTIRVPPLPDVAAAAGAKTQAVEGRPRLSRLDHALRGRRSARAQQAVGNRGAGRHQDPAPYRPPARRLGRRAGDAAAAGAPARPRHLRRAGGRQAAVGRGEARPRLPDPLGAEDLLGAGARRAEAAARQDRGGAGQGGGAGRRPRAQGAPRRAGRRAIGGDPLRGGGPGRADGLLRFAQARHRAAASASRPYGHHRPSDPGRREISERRRAAGGRREQAASACATHQLSASIGGGGGRRHRAAAGPYAAELCLIRLSRTARTPISRADAV